MLKNKRFEISVNDIYEESLKSCIEFCEIQAETVRGKKLLEKCLSTREKFCKDCIIKVVVTPFSKDYIKEDAFQIEDNVIYCNELGKMVPPNMIGGYMYAVFTEPLSYEMMSTLQMYYADCWMSAYVEAGWKSIKSLLVKEAVKDFCAKECGGSIVVSESFAPGFGGMQMGSTADIFELMKLSKYGLELQDECVITPAKSIIGIYLVNSSINK